MPGPGHTGPLCTVLDTKFCLPALSGMLTHFLFTFGRLHALTHIQNMKADGHPIQAAVASRTDEPRWARICMDHLVLGDGSTTLSDVFGDFVEINYGSKIGHIERLHRKSGIALEEMAFFDNERWNIQDVQAGLPVKCYYTPEKERYISVLQNSFTIR